MFLLFDLASCPLSPPFYARRTEEGPEDANSELPPRSPMVSSSAKTQSLLKGPADPMKVVEVEKSPRGPPKEK
jgi:hypothetical protein